MEEWELVRKGTIMEYKICPMSQPSCVVNCQWFIEDKCAIYVLALAMMPTVVHNKSSPSDPELSERGVLIGKSLANMVSSPMSEETKEILHGGENKPAPKRKAKKK